jgi:hypothetical protein
MDWKTTTSRYAEEAAGLLSLDPQLICYSWITGISEFALVVFVRKHQPEIQYGRSLQREQPDCRTTAFEWPSQRDCAPDGECGSSHHPAQDEWRGVD